MSSPAPPIRAGVGEPGTAPIAPALEGVPVRDIAGVIGRRLNVPVVSKAAPRKQPTTSAGSRPFAVIDNRASSGQTRELLGWQPQQPGLIPDIDRPRYFET